MMGLFRSPKSSDEWSKLLKALDSVFPSGSQEGQALTRVSKQLKRDLQQIEKEEFIFYEGENIARMTQQNVDYLRHWHISGEAPSLVALGIAAMERFEIKRPDLRQAVLTAGVLGETLHDHPYHNNFHFCKVLLQTIRLVCVHNRIYSGTARELNEEEIAALLIAACIHDIGHDGLGNTVKGVFIQGRLEKQSFELAKPYLEASGLQSEDILKQIQIMLLATDVSPLGDPASPAGQMKAAYRFHFLGEKDRHHKINLSDDLSALELDEKLTLMSCLLHEADIMTSAGLTYEVTQFETALYCQEMRYDDARPEHALNFLNQVCQRQMLSDAAQKLCAANIARIYALTEEDMKAGNEPYPKPHHTDFILMRGGDESSDNAKTIN